jgi:hypothetical protein
LIRVTFASVLTTVLISGLTTPAMAMRLQEVFETAPPHGNYDRYLSLETGVVYTGGLLIGPTWDDDRQSFRTSEVGLNVMIDGRGAILDLQGQQICISYGRYRLDIQDCIIIGGGIRFRGDISLEEDLRPHGSVRHCTFWQPHEYAVRLDGAGAGILLERNIVVDTVDTGLDFMAWNGEIGSLMPTGLAFGLSVQTMTFGFPDVRENWTYFTDPVVNAEDLHHFGFL